MSGENTDWKIKINDMLQTCQNELRKTTRIGKKMLSASQTNAQLHETYEAIGVLIKKEWDAGNLHYENDELKKMIEKINRLELELETFESEVQDIKKD